MQILFTGFNVQAAINFVNRYSIIDGITVSKVGDTAAQQYRLGIEFGIPHEGTIHYTDFVLVEPDDVLIYDAVTAKLYATPRRLMEGYKNG